MSEQRIGKYVVIEEIGRGAMGVVYKALDPLIDRIVAVKTIRFDMYSQPEQREEAQKRFLREAKSAGQLSHPHIATIYEVGEDQGQAFIAMEYIDGRSLEDWLAQKRRWGVEEAVRFIIEVAEALDSTHKKNIVHRDIKPGNILVDAEGHPHLVDFGIARIPASTLTQTTAVLGTPFYMAPEQVAARKIDHRVDIFALGAIFYEMLTLEKPFTGDNLTTVIYKIMNEEPPPLRQFSANLPEGLDPIVRKLLAKDPDARYPTCRALANDLIRFAEEAGLETGRKPQAEASLTETRKIKPVAAAKPAEKKPKGPASSRKPLLIVGVAMAAVVVVAGGILLLTRNDAGLPGKRIEAPATVEPGTGDPGAKPETKAENKPENKAETKPENKVENKTEDKPAVKPEPDSGPGAKVKPQDRPAGPGPESKPTTVPASKTGNPVSNAGKPVVKTDPAAGKTAENKPAEPGPTDAAAEAVSRASQAWAKGDGNGAMAAVREALKIDPENEAAKSLARDIALRGAEAEVQALADSYLAGLKNKTLRAFYEANAAPSLAARLKSDLALMDKVYDKFTGTVGEVKLATRSAQYPRFRARASFPHTITGRKRSNWKNETIFQGVYTWILEKEGSRWIIADLSFEAL
jgi:tRNA A-37 threonylcarbamoyl transferase component Bud32